MSVFKNLDISGSGMGVNRAWMELLSNNIANANTTRTPGGGSYKNQQMSFANVLDNTSSGAAGGATLGNGVRVAQVQADNRPGAMIYNPAHPDADKQGYVTLPNVNLTTEMVNMIAATRTYEANVAAFNAGRQMYLKSLDVGK